MKVIDGLCLPRAIRRNGVGVVSDIVWTGCTFGQQNRRQLMGRSFDLYWHRCWWRRLVKKTLIVVGDSPGHRQHQQKEKK